MPGDGLVDILELLQLIYAAGLDPAEWPTVTAYLGQAFPFAAVALQVADLTDKQQFQFSKANWEAGALESYAEYYIKSSPWIGVHCRARIGVPYSADDACPASSFANTEFYNDWIQPYKVGCGATAVKLLDDGKRFAALSMNYDERYVDRVKEPIAHLLRDLVPHLNRAVEMNRQVAHLETLSQSVEGMLNSIPRPALLLTPDCRVNAMNRRAEQAVQRNNLTLTQAGHLVLAHPRDTNRLQQVVWETARRDEFSASSENGLVPFVIPGVPGPHSIFVFPAATRPSQSIHVHEVQGNRLVLATVQMRQDVEPPPEDRLMEVFSFTAAESRLVAALAAGKRLSDYADETGRSIHTVRTQLKSALAKADCRTQTDLLRLISHLAGPF